MKIFGQQLDKLHYILLVLVGITSFLWIQQLVGHAPKTSDNSNYDFLMSKYKADSLFIAEQYSDALAEYTVLDSLYPNRINLAAISALIGKKQHEENIKEQSSSTSIAASAKQTAQPSSKAETASDQPTTATATPAGDGQPVLTVTKSVLKITNFDGVSVDYIGEVENGKANGFGLAVFDKKGFYEGQWANNLCNGEGTYYWQNGDTYKGHYLNGYRTGYGTYTFVTGEVYEGEWKDNLRNGQGTLKNKRGKIMFSGEWKDDAPVKKSKRKKK